MGVSKVNYGNTTLIDLTSDTVAANKLMSGYTAHGADGEAIVGTAGAYVTGTTLYIPSGMGNVSGTTLNLS